MSRIQWLVESLKSTNLWKRSILATRIAQSGNSFRLLSAWWINQSLDKRSSSKSRYTKTSLELMRMILIISILINILWIDDTIVDANDESSSDDIFEDSIRETPQEDNDGMNPSPFYATWQLIEFNPYCITKKSSLKNMKDQSSNHSHLKLMNNSIITRRSD